MQDDTYELAQFYNQMMNNSKDILKNAPCLKW